MLLKSEQVYEKNLKTIPQRTDKILTMDKFFGDIVASKHNQHEVCVIIGKTGKGKSNGAIDIAYAASVYIAEKLGGKPEDYFTIDNMAIMTEEEVVRVAKSIKKHGIYILDDIGVSWSARDWAKKGNKILNRIVQTFRTKNNLLLLTVPDTFIIDKIPRHLMHHQIEMVMSVFDAGFSVGKLKTVTRNQEQFWPYLRYKGVKYTRCVFEMAPVHLIEEYERIRTDLQDKMQQDDLKELEGIIAEQESEKNGTKEPRVTKRQRVVELIRDVNAGVYINLKEACAENNLNFSYARNVKYDFGLSCA